MEIVSYNWHHGTLEHHEEDGDADERKLLPLLARCADLVQGVSYQTDSCLDGRVTVHKLEIERYVVDRKEEYGSTSRHGDVKQHHVESRHKLHGEDLALWSGEESQSLLEAEGDQTNSEHNDASDEFP